MQPAFQEEKLGVVQTLIRLDNIRLVLDGSFENCCFKQRAILGTKSYNISLYLKPPPELGLVLSLQRKKLSDVMASDH